MLTAGIWKGTDLIGAAARVNQALVPAALSLPAAICLSISEAFSGVLLLIPRFRRWGAILAGLLLIAFVLYMGIFYNRLVGEECNCFPWVERVVGPIFFIGDFIMLGFAVIAGVWARPSRGLRGASLALAVVCVFVGVNLGIALTQSHGKMAPAAIAVNGAQYNLHDGKVLLYFFDPECTHCLFAAQEMSEYNWENVSIILVPTDRAQFSDQFIEAAGLPAPLSSDAGKLREIYSFGDPPFAVALVDGETKKELTVFEGSEPRASLAELGFIQ